MKKRSQKARLLAALQAGQLVTAIDALDYWGCFRLAARVNDLKCDGWEIESRPFRTRTGKIVAQYYLPKEARTEPTLRARYSKKRGRK